MDVDEHVASRLKDRSKEAFTGINIDGIHAFDAIKFRHAFVGSSFAILVVLVGCCISAGPDKTQDGLPPKQDPQVHGLQRIQRKQGIGYGHLSPINDKDTCNPQRTHQSKVYIALRNFLLLDKSTRTELGT